MPPDNFLRTPCFLKWVGWRYDQTVEIGKIQGLQEKKRMLFLSTSSSKQSPTVCSWALPWEGEKATEGGVWCLCVFPWCDIVIYNKKCIFILIPDTGLLKSFTNHLTNIYVKNISGAPPTNISIQGRCFPVDGPPQLEPVAHRHVARICGFGGGPEKKKKTFLGLWHETEKWNQKSVLSTGSGPEKKQQLCGEINLFVNLILSSWDCFTP